MKRRLASRGDETPGRTVEPRQWAGQPPRSQASGRPRHPFTCPSRCRPSYDTVPARADHWSIRQTSGHNFPQISWKRLAGLSNWRGGVSLRAMPTGWRLLPFTGEGGGEADGGSGRLHPVQPHLLHRLSAVPLPRDCVAGEDRRLQVSMLERCSKYWEMAPLRRTTSQGGTRRVRAIKARAARARSQGPAMVLVVTGVTSAARSRPTTAALAPSRARRRRGIDLSRVHQGSAPMSNRKLGR